MSESMWFSRFAVIFSSIVAIITLAFVLYMEAQGIFVSERIWALLGMAAGFATGVHVPNPFTAVKPPSEEKVA